MNAFTKDIEPHWSAIQPILSIQNEKEYDAAVEYLTLLVDEIGTNENHPLYELMDTLGTVIHAYEESNVRMPDVEGSEILQFLMDEHNLTPSDLEEIAPKDTVIQILSGQQLMSVEQIRRAAKCFAVSPAVFI